MRELERKHDMMEPAEVQACLGISAHTLQRWRDAEILLPVTRPGADGVRGECYRRDAVTILAEALNVHATRPPARHESPRCLPPGFFRKWKTDRRADP